MTSKVASFQIKIISIRMIQPFLSSTDRREPEFFSTISGIQHSVFRALTSLLTIFSLQSFPPNLPCEATYPLVASQSPEIQGATQEGPIRHPKAVTPSLRSCPLAFQKLKLQTLQEVFNPPFALPSWPQGPVPNHTHSKLMHFIIMNMECDVLRRCFLFEISCRS